MKGITDLELLYEYTINHNCTGICISFKELDSEFLELIKNEFGEEMFNEIIGMLISSDYIIFEKCEESVANKLFDILSKKPYCNKVYAYISGPNGIRGENT